MKKALIYIIIFVALQVTVGFACTLAYNLCFKSIKAESPLALLITSGIIFSLAIILFLAFKWYRASRDYIRTRPWSAMVWASLLAIGMIMPLAWIEGLIPKEWTTDLVGKEMLQMMKLPGGYFVICLLAPLAEEIIFRGAIISALQAWFREGRMAEICDKKGISNDRRQWIAIGLSAFFFALVHLNPAQLPHALIVGVLLGWLYVRTGSIVLCFLIHWINNSSAYALAMMFPFLPMDAELPEYFNGNTTAVIQAVVSSLLIAIPALYQLNRITKQQKSLTL